MISKFVSEIKKKRNLRSLPDDFVQDLVVEFFKRYPKSEKILENHVKPLKSKEFKFMMKEIRKKLHDVYGVFILKEKCLKSLKEHLKKTKKLDEKALQLHTALLSCHQSSFERMDFYYEIYKNIFSITGKPKSILDLACGLNPLSFPFMGLKKLAYFAMELTCDGSKFVQEYFDIMQPFGLNGRAFAMNLMKLKKLPKSDVCFLFKVLDSLECLEKNYSEEILGKIDSKFIVVSFPTVSIGGKNPIKQRGWFFRMLRENNLKAETFEIENEIFYIIKK